MKRLILFFLFLLAAVWLGVQLAQDPGYLLIAYRKWTIEMPLWFTLVALITLLLLAYILFNLLSQVRRANRRLRRWSRRRTEQQTTTGIIALIEGDWAKAEKQLRHQPKNNIINYLAAAKAAHEQGQFEACAKYLAKAQKLKPQAEFAVALTQAKLQMSRGQLESALATLKRLHEINPKQVYVLKLLQQLYIELEDYTSLFNLLPLLRRYKVLAAPDFAKLALTVYQHLLQAAQDSKPALIKTWQSFPRDVTAWPEVVAEYAKALMNAGADADAELYLRKILKKQWSEQLISLYGKLKEVNTKQLGFVETTLKAYKEQPEQLLCLARLCVKLQLWGKALHYFELSVQAKANPKAYLEMAQLLEQLDKPEQASRCYQSGLNNLVSGAQNYLPLCQKLGGP